MTTVSTVARRLAFALLASMAATRGVNTQQTPQAPNDPVVAVIDGQTLTLSEVDARWREQDAGSFAYLQQEQYAARRRALDSIIGAYVLEREAARRGLSVQKLLDQELPKRMPSVSEADILEAYTRAGLAAQGVSVDQARDSLVQMLEKRRSKGDALSRYLDELRGAARNISITFDAPRQRIPVLPTDRITGKASARIEVVEFGDFQCPICRTMVPVLKRLQTEHKDDVRFVWKDFPLEGHPDARPAAEAARCAADQGKFWEYHDKLFDNQQALGKNRLKDYAKQLKLEPTAFATCLDKATHTKDVESALLEAAGHGVSATPTVFINGRLVVGAVPYETYDRIIREELSRPPDTR